MPKTGKERKARRRARQAAEAARASQQAPGGAADVGSVKASPLPPNAGDAAGGAAVDHQAEAEAELVAAAGDHWATDGSRRMMRRDQALVHRSLRWRTDATDRTFEGRDPRELTALEIGILKTRVTMLDPDPKIAVGLGVRTLIALEAQNQRDDLNYDPFKAAGPAPAGPVAGTGDAPPAAANVQVNIIMPDNGRGPQIG